MLNFKTVSHILLLTIFSISLLQTSYGKALNKADLNRLTKVGDEWRKTYHFNRQIWQSLQEQLEAVVDSQHLLNKKDITPEFKKQIEDYQAKALQKIVNEGEKNIPYLLREYINDLKEQSKDWSQEYREVSRSIDKRLTTRQEAVEAAIKSIGLAAISSLSDLHARSMRAQTNLLSQKLKTMLDEIVRLGQIEQEKARYNQLVSDSEKSTKVDRDLQFKSDVWEAPSQDSEGESKVPSPDSSTSSRGI